MPHRLASHIVALIFVALVCAACGQSSPPASPSPVVSTASFADFSGIWQGQYQITTCSGERVCWTRVGTTRPYVLRLTQSGSLVTGVLEAWSFTIDVGGEVTKEGVLTLSGSRAGTGGPEGMGEVHVPGFVLRLDPQRGLAGDLSYNVVPAYESGFGVLTHTGVVLSATHGRLEAVGPTALAAYEGTWSGTFVTESCTPSGSAYCAPELPEGAYRLNMDLHVDGGVLTGELVLEQTAVPVTASVTATGLVVEGSASRAVSGGTDVTQISRWSASRDIYARLNGTFEYERAYVRPAATSRSSHYRARLVGVTRRP